MCIPHLVVVPRHDFDLGLGSYHGTRCVNDRRACITAEICGDQLYIVVADYMRPCGLGTRMVEKRVDLQPSVAAQVGHCMESYRCGLARRGAIHKSLVPW